MNVVFFIEGGVAQDETQRQLVRAAKLPIMDQHCLEWLQRCFNIATDEKMAVVNRVLVTHLT